jgi:hypothetical protein
MEILRFDEIDAPTPKRKRPSKAWLALSMVAALMGVGTAFASSTIQLNNVQLGQGVTSIVSCDQNIGIVPKTGLSFPEEATAYFELKNIVIGSPDTTLGIAGAVSEECAGKIFKITLYDEGHYSVGYDGARGGTTLCTYFRNGTENVTYIGHDTFTHNATSECLDDAEAHTSSIYFFAAAASDRGDKTYSVNFYGYNLSDPTLKIDPSNITVETVSDYPVIGG